MELPIGRFRWKELAVTNEGETYAKLTGELSAAGIPYREKVQYIGCGTRRGGTISGLGENQRYTNLYQIFVKKSDLERAKFICHI